MLQEHVNFLLRPRVHHNSCIGLIAEHMNDQLISNVLTSVKNIALVGASDKSSRPAFMVMAYLLAQGYNVIPVNPLLAGQTLQGKPVYQSLTSIPLHIDMVDVFRRAEAAGEIAEEAIAIGAKVLWLQQGIINEAAAHLAEKAGMTVIMDRCPRIEIPRLGLENR